MKVTALQIQRVLISSEQLLSNVTSDITKLSVKTFSIFQTIILFLNTDFFPLCSSDDFQLPIFSPQLALSCKLLHYISDNYKHTFLLSSPVQPCTVVWPFAITLPQLLALPGEMQSLFPLKPAYFLGWNALTLSCSGALHGGKLYLSHKTMTKIMHQQT